MAANAHHQGLAHVWWVIQDIRLFGPTFGYFRFGPTFGYFQKIWSHFWVLSEDLVPLLGTFRRFGPTFGYFQKIWSHFWVLSEFGPTFGYFQIGPIFYHTLANQIAASGQIQTTCFCPLWSRKTSVFARYESKDSWLAALMLAEHVIGLSGA